MKMQNVSLFLSICFRHMLLVNDDDDDVGFPLFFVQLCYVLLFKNIFIYFYFYLFFFKFLCVCVYFFVCVRVVCA